MSRREPFRTVKGALLWGGDVMAELRGDSDAINVALYLLTCGESCRTSIGIFRTGVGAISDALGTSPERVRDALGKVCATGFARFDERYQVVWVCEAARHQYGEEGPEPKANQGRGFLSALPALLDFAPRSEIWPAFWERYGAAWGKAWRHLGDALPSHLGPVPDESGTRSERVANESPNASGGRVEEEKREEWKKPPSEGPASGTPPAKKLNAQAERIARIEERYKRSEVKPPAPGILAKWLKTLGSELRMMAFLDDMEHRGRLGAMEYCGKVVQDWEPPRRAPSRGLAQTSSAVAAPPSYDHLPRLTPAREA